MQSPIYLLSWVAALGGAWLLWSFGIRVWLLDNLRERLFEIRFRLFSLGMSDELPFDSDAYRTIETLLCGLLQYAHRISFLTLLLSSLEDERERKEQDYVDVSAQIKLKLSRLEADTMQRLLVIIADAQKAVILYAAFSSLLFMSIFAVLRLCEALGIVSLTDQRQRTVRIIEREAYLAEMKRGPRVATA